MTFPLVKLIKKYIEVFQIKGNSFFTFNSSMLKVLLFPFLPAEYLADWLG